MGFGNDIGSEAAKMAARQLLVLVAFCVAVGFLVGWLFF